jgi:uncharacterized protein (DUF1684 family)
VKKQSAIVSALMVSVILLGASRAHAIELAQEQRAVDEWYQGRLERLIGPNGWITLIGLYWLHEGNNTFGREPKNSLVLDHPSMPTTLGTFVVHRDSVMFTAKPNSVVTHKDQKIKSIAMQSDASTEPTVLKSGTLEFFVIERVGKFAVRVRDTEHPARRAFKGIERYPVSVDWVMDAKFEPYVPVRHIDIVNILGMTESMVSPGALVFEKDGRTFRLDAILEAPDEKELFIMFADATSARETYGAGRFLYIPLPSNGRAVADFNRSYNPPCAFNDFATCPLPPKQNRLSLRITAGEKKYDMTGNIH